MAHSDGMIRPLYGWVPSSSSDRAAWLSPYDYPVAVSRRGARWLASHYSYTARILHPAYRDGREPVTWREIATIRGERVAAGASFAELIGTDDPNAVLSEVFDTRPVQGSLPDTLLPVLHELLRPHGTHGLLWTGYGRLGAAMASAATVSDGAANYWLLESAPDPFAATITHESPNFWWPGDRSWCVGTGIDSVDTLIASNSADLIDSVLQAPDLEAVLVT